jgi:hypothetical protein
LIHPVQKRLLQPGGKHGFDSQLILLPDPERELHIIKNRLG